LAGDASSAASAAQSTSGNEADFSNDSGNLRRILGTGALLAFGLAYLVPLTVFTTYGSATRATEGHLPLAYLVTTGAMIFTSVSYAHLVRAFPTAGSAYTYARATFGERAGFLVGWALLLDYLLLPAINYLVIGLYVHANFSGVPIALPIFAAIALVTVLNIVGIDVVRNASLAMVLVQLVFAAVFVVAALKFAPGPLPLDPFYSLHLAWPAVFAGSAILCLSFLGFDAVSTLSEEARDPERTVPRAILLTTCLGGLIFTALSYASALVVPDWHSLKVSDSAGLEVMQPLGYGMVVFFLAAYIVGCTASAIASQASVARILFAMGRDAILPRTLGVLNRRFKTPLRATLLVALLSCAVSFLDLDTLVSIVSFGALSAFSLVNLAVIKHFVIDRRRRATADLIIFALMPLVGFLLTAWLWLSLSRSALMVGLGWLSLGIVYLVARPKAGLGGV
jgi:amino acid transporter